MYLVFRPKNAAVCDGLVKKAFIAAETPAFTLILLIGQQVVISLKKDTQVGKASGRKSLGPINQPR